jgi:hypothetical protein
MRAHVASSSISTSKNTGRKRMKTRFPNTKYRVGQMIREIRKQTPAMMSRFLFAMWNLRTMAA